MITQKIEAENIHTYSWKIVKNTHGTPAPFLVVGVGQFVSLNVQHLLDTMIKTTVLIRSKKYSQSKYYYYISDLNDQNYKYKTRDPSL